MPRAVRTSAAFAIPSGISSSAESGEVRVEVVSTTSGCTASM